MRKLIVGMLAVLGAFTLLGMLVGLGFVMVAAGSKPKVKDGSVLELKVSGDYIERKPSDFVADVMLEDTGEFRELLDAVNRAAGDDRIEGILARIDNNTLGWAKTQELRDAIRDFRATGKFAFAYFETAGEWTNATLPYYLGTAFDSVFLAPPGDVNLVGFNLQSQFLRGTLDKLGIYPDMDHIGDYKTAMNSITEKSYTPAHREMMEWLGNSLRDQFIRDVAEGRRLDPERVATILDGGPYIAREALENGLVDELLYWDQVLERVDARTDGKDRRMAQGKYLEAAGAPYAEGKSDIALIYGDGAVMRGKSNYSPMTGGMAMGSETVAQAFREAADNKAIKAIVFRVDSPGGSYVASDVIYREVMRAREKKPVVVSMSDLAGSGGYFVALPAHKILAQPGSITTSIGVLSGKMNMKGFYDKIGLSKDHVPLDDNATFYWDYSNYTPGERARFQNLLDRIYMDFTTKVAAARDMKWEEVDAVGRGRVFTGEQAKQHGLIDELGGLDDAIAIARELAEIDSSETVRLRVIPKKKSMMENLMERGGATRSSASVLREQVRWLQAQVRMLEQASGAQGVLSMPPVQP